MKHWLVSLLLFCSSTPAFAQDDCPPGHVRHPAISALDDASMLAAYTASARAILGRDPSMVAGSGVDDGWYYIRQSNHFGVYGDDQCHAGWSGYWESWLRNGHGDLALVQTPARFQPNSQPPTPNPNPAPAPPAPKPEGVLLAKVDALAARVEALYALEAEQSRAAGEAHAAINQNVTDGRTENRNFFKAVGDHWRSIAAVAGPIVTWYVTKRSVAQ